METDIEKQYEKDLENFCDHGDIGDDWCGDDVLQAILTWIKSNIDFSDPILEIGCGNANMLFQLYRLGYTNVVGIDNSPTAIKLATEISHQECAKIKLEVGDLLGPVPSEKEGSLLNCQYKLLLDKGLFDLDAKTVKNIEEFREKYLKNVQTLLQPKGILLIAVCSYTEEELKSHICKGFDVLSVLPTPLFEFGGKKGHNVTVIVFQKKD